MGGSAWWLAALVAWAPAATGAEPYPTRSVRWVVPYAAGGSTDTTARILAQPLSDALKQQIVIDNRGGAGGNGTSPHVAGELFKLLTGVAMVHVPYRGDAPALQDLLAGQIQVIFGQLPAALPFIRSGALRPLGVTTPTRSPLLPDVPTVAEAGVPGFEATSWYGIFAPTGTPREIVARLNAEANAALERPELRARLLEIGCTPLGGSPEDFARFLEADIAKWAKVVRAANLAIE